MERQTKIQLTVISLILLAAILAAILLPFDIPKLNGVRRITFKDTIVRKEVSN